MAQEPLQDYGYNAHYLTSNKPSHPSYDPAATHYAQHPNATPRALEPYTTSPLHEQPPNTQYSGDYHQPNSPYGPPQPYQMDPEYPHPPLQQHYANTQQLPSVSSFIGTDGYVNGHGNAPQSFDTTGQIQPIGVRPRLTTSLSEEEGSLCFQVDVNGICVARREDNHMINGTKLLNVVGMTRGRRDGILKAEKEKQVVKIGPMHLKGVWIPYERALALANQEKITEKLYPLFVHNISALLFHPSNGARPLPLSPTQTYPPPPGAPEQGMSPEDDDRRPRL